MKKLKYNKEIFHTELTPSQTMYKDDRFSEVEQEFLKNCDLGNIHTVTLFLSNRISNIVVDVSKNNIFTYTALICCCKNEDDEMLRLLLRHGADVNIQGDENYNSEFQDSFSIYYTNKDSLLHYVCENNKYSILDVLLKIPNINVNIKNYHNIDPLSIAIAYNHIEIINSLLDCDKLELSDTLENYKSFKTGRYAKFMEIYKKFGALLNHGSV